MTTLSRYLTLTQANLDNCHIYLTECMDIFPEDALGGPNRSEAAPRAVAIQCGAQVVHTDIVRGRRIFRQRRWLRQFFRDSGLVAGDRVLLDQLDPYSYRLSRAQTAETTLSLPCLSIQQPWADLILDGKKLVENRSRIWNEAEEALAAGKSVLLAIHASSSLSLWDGLTEEKRTYYAPNWSPRQASARGAVLGVVNIVRFCRPKDLPPHLQNHKFTNHGPHNWCWVLGNPCRMAQPLRMRGNAWLFHVDIPKKLLTPASPAVANGEW